MTSQLGLCRLPIDGREATRDTNAAVRVAMERNGVGIRIAADMVSRNATASGAIETTHHVVWVGGVKLAEPPPYVEH